MSGESVGCIDQVLCALALQAVDTLRSARLSVVTAESCTGGLIAALLSHGTQASDCLHGGFVAYTKEQKTMALGVSAELLARLGAVHGEVAEKMATGALERSPADLAVSTTGVLGPNADEDQNPPGLVYIGMSRRGAHSEVIRLTYEGHPDSVRRAVIVDVLTRLQHWATARRH